MFDLSAWNDGVWLWAIIDIAAVIILAVAIIYGTRMWRKRSRDPRIVRESDEATRRLYHPNRDRADKSAFR